LFRNASDAAGKVGMTLGADGTVRLLKGLVRIPDVSFTRWERLPKRKVPREPIPDLAPDLAVEVLSRKNTKREMERKLKEYFLAGVRLVWFVDPRTRGVRVFRSPEEMAELSSNDTLNGGDVLPGLRIRVAELFAELEDEPKPPPRKKRT
jgi:Uma2 family endonuclease